MILPDVNVLVHAFRVDAPRHAEYREWLHESVTGQEPLALSELVLAGMIRVLTHPRVFVPPTPPDKAFGFAEALRAQDNCVLVHPGPRHWEIFTQLCKGSGAKGNLVPDAYLAALAIEHGCEWITSDRDFARFPGLRWRHPLE